MKSCLVTFVIVLTITGTDLAAQSFGRFVGTVATRWVTPDRDMELLEDFTYIDPLGRRWTARRGLIINGASIPRALWTIVGSPFTGEYRNASVVHDAACALQIDTWEHTHEMFYYAMRAGGVGDRRALFMFAAVYHYGPRWSVVAANRGPEGIVDRLKSIFGGIFRQDRLPNVPESMPVTEEQLHELQQTIEQQNLSTLEEVIRLDPQ